RFRVLEAFSITQRLHVAEDARSCPGALRGLVLSTRPRLILNFWVAAVACNRGGAATRRFGSSSGAGSRLGSPSVPKAGTAEAPGDGLLVAARPRLQATAATQNHQKINEEPVHVLSLGEPALATIASRSIKIEWDRLRSHQRSQRPLEHPPGRPGHRVGTE